jgi:uracil-DNA glycosylase
VERKRARLREPHVAPLTAYVEGLRRARGSDDVPWFDPDEAGVGARILLLLEAPGPRAALAKGSGFVSPDNDDQTAQNMWTFLRAAGIDRRREVVTWNIVPWYVGDGTRIRAVTARDLDEARPALRALLALLPALRVVVLLGGAAQRGWDRVGVETGLPTVRAKHPSPLVVNTTPGAAEAIRSALAEAHRLAATATESRGAHG